MSYLRLSSLRYSYPQCSYPQCSYLHCRHLYQSPLVSAVVLGIILLISTLSLVSCGFGGGGGGGGDGADSKDSLNPGNFTLFVSPSSIDTGDRTRVRLVLSDISSLGAILKIRFPENLDYVRGTSTVDINGIEAKLDPNVVASSDGSTYVVYFLTSSSLGTANAGEIGFVLRGAGAVLDGAIEADIDLDDPALRPSQKFSVTNPLFEVQQDQNIDVVGASSSAGTATPTPAAAGTTTPTPTAAASSTATSTPAAG